MRTEAITLLKEDVLALGQMVNRSVTEMALLLEKNPAARLSFVEDQEETINVSCQQIEERCLDLLMERQAFSPQEIRTLVASIIIAAKFERMGDHANRVARIAQWAAEDTIDIPPELAEMAHVVRRTVEDVLLCFVSDAIDKVPQIIQSDNRIDYLHDFLSKRLLSDLGEQDHAQAQMRAQFLFCARFIERMGDAATSVAKRVFFIGTGTRFKAEE